MWETRDIQVFLNKRDLVSDPQIPDGIIRKPEKGKNPCSLSKSEIRIWEENSNRDSCGGKQP